MGMDNIKSVGWSTDVTPTAAALGPTIYLAWRVSGAESLHWSSLTNWSPPLVMTAPPPFCLQGPASSPDHLGEWSAEQVIAGVGSAANPVMAADVSGNAVYMFWRGVHGDQGIYWSVLRDGAWAAQQNLPGEASSTGPAATWFHDRIYLAWKGPDADTNVYLRSFASGTWSPRQQIPGAATVASPAIAAMGDSLVAAWRGAGDEGIWIAGFDGATWSGVRRLPGAGTSSSPALVSIPPASAPAGPGLDSGGPSTDPRAYLLWKGAGADTQLYYAVFANGAWSSQKAAGGASSTGPCMVVARVAPNLPAALVALGFWKQDNGTGIMAGEFPSEYWIPVGSEYTGPGGAHKFTFFAGVLEFTGTVAVWADNPQVDKNMDGFDLILDPGCEGLFEISPGVARLHCESYPEGISDIPHRDWPVPNTEPQINHVVPYEPWAAAPFRAHQGSSPGWPPYSADKDPIKYIDAVGNPQTIMDGDHVRIRGRLIMENGHPLAEESPPSWGPLWYELHPFDWHNVTADNVSGHFAVGPGGISTHRLVLTAPIYPYAHGWPSQGPPTVCWPAPKNVLDGGDPGRDYWLAVPVHYGPGARMYRPWPALQAPASGPTFLAPVRPSTPAGLLPNYRETVVINTTGRPLNQLRTLSVTPTGLTVTAQLKAPETITDQDLPLAHPTDDQQVLAIRYEVWWDDQPGALVFTTHHTGGSWSPPLPAGQQAGITGRPVAAAGASAAAQESSFVVSLTGGGLVYFTHTPAGFTVAEPIKPLVGGDIGQASAVAAAAPWDAQEPGVQYMFALTDGRLLHTTRNTAGTWYPVGDVKGQVGDFGQVTALAGCTDPAKQGVTQWVVVTAGGGLWHLARFADGSWASEDVIGQIGSLGEVVAVAAVGATTDFGSTQFVFVTADDRILHTTRNSDSRTWAPAGDVKGQIGDFGTATAAAGVSSVPGATQFLFSTVDGRCFHTTRNPDGTWYPAGLVKGQIGDVGQVGAVAAASPQTDNADYLLAVFDPGGIGPT
jgi:hypothetical protein